MCESGIYTGSGAAAPESRQRRQTRRFMLVAPPGRVVVAKAPERPLQRSVAEARRRRRRTTSARRAGALSTVWNADAPALGSGGEPAGSASNRATSRARHCESVRFSRTVSKETADQVSETGERDAYVQLRRPRAQNRGAHSPSGLDAMAPQRRLADPASPKRSGSRSLDCPRGTVQAAPAPAPGHAHRSSPLRSPTKVRRFPGFPIAGAAQRPSNVRPNPINPPVSPVWVVGVLGCRWPQIIRRLMSLPEVPVVRITGSRQGRAAGPVALRWRRTSCSTPA